MSQNQNSTTQTSTTQNQSVQPSRRTTQLLGTVKNSLRPIMSELRQRNLYSGDLRDLNETLTRTVVSNLEKSGLFSFTPKKNQSRQNTNRQQTKQTTESNTLNSRNRQKVAKIPVVTERPKLNFGK